jgi:hypothetical protein
VGSELVYAPHHAPALAATIAALLRHHAAAQASSQAVGEIEAGRKAACVLVQRSDRPGWHRFLEVCLSFSTTISSACSVI